MWLVTSGYPVGQSDYGNKAYPPLMLLKAIPLQKQFGIKSDPELGNRINAALTEYEIRRNKMVSKVRYKIEQYFGITGKYHGAGKARFTTITKENWDHLSEAKTFNIKRVILTKRKQKIMAAI